MTNVFGPLVTPQDVTKAVEQHIRSWGRAYWDNAARGRGYTRRLPSIATYRQTNVAPERWTGDGLPTLVIVAEDPQGTDHVDGQIVLTIPVGIAIVVAANSQDAANQLAGVYGVALAQLLHQKTNLEPAGLDGGQIVEWIPFDSGEVQSELVGDNKRMLAVVSQGVLVQVPMFSEFGGPSEPTAEPDPPAPEQDFPTADEVVITLDEELTP